MRNASSERWPQVIGGSFGTASATSEITSSVDAKVGNNAILSSTGGAIKVEAFHNYTTGGSVIKAEVTYTYASSTAKMITGGLTMADTFYSRPRKVAQITRTAS